MKALQECCFLENVVSLHMKVDFLQMETVRQIITLIIMNWRCRISRGPAAPLALNDALNLFFFLSLISSN